MNACRDWYGCLLALLLSLNSCSLCSQQNVNTSAVCDSVEETLKSNDREGWSNLPEVGYPILSDTIPSRILERYCYTVSYNPRTRQPNWVMWQLTDEHVMPKKDGVWNEFREDNQIRVR